MGQVSLECRVYYNRDIAQGRAVSFPSPRVAMLKWRNW